jgi:hypothetical protein
MVLLVPETLADTPTPPLTGGDPHPVPQGRWQRVAAYSRRAAVTPWGRSVRFGAGAWAVASVGYFALSLFYALDAPSGPWDYHPQARLHQVFANWFGWDAGWYVGLAEHGYRELKDYAFFPLLPALIRVADVVLPFHTRFAALVVSGLAMFAAFTVLHRLAGREFGEDVARRSVWYLLAFPTGFFLATSYPSALVVAISAGCLYALRGGHWWAAGALGALASATRPTGLLLILPFGYEYLRVHGPRPRWNVLAGSLFPVGLAVFMAYSSATIGDAFAFRRSQEYWGREFAPPWKAVLDSLDLAVESRLVRSPVNLLELGSVLFILAAIALMLVGPWRFGRQRWVYPLYAIAQLVFVISFPPRVPSVGGPEPLLSAGRHVLEIFPAFLLLAVVLRRDLPERLYTTVGLLVQGALLLHFLRGGWVA